MTIQNEFHRRHGSAGSGRDRDLASFTRCPGPCQEVPEQAAAARAPVHRAIIAAKAPEATRTTWQCV